MCLLFPLNPFQYIFWASGKKFRYWPETGYQSEKFETLSEALAKAKSEMANLVSEFDCLPMFPIWIIARGIDPTKAKVELTT